MKSIFLHLFLCILISLSTHAASKYWVGTSNGDWSNSANWSDVLNGPGGASVPGTQDIVFFADNSISLIHMDVSATISSLRVNGSVTIYASTPVVFTLLSSLSIPANQMLKDSTSADVSFKTVFSGATAATGTIIGTWIFEGGVPVSEANSSGASFTAEPGSLVQVLGQNNSNYYGQVIFKRNTGRMSSTQSSLSFANYTNYIMDSKQDAFIPLANWAVFSTVQVLGNIEKFELLTSGTLCGNLIFDLPDLAADLDLSLPDGSLIAGSLYIRNTNNHTLTLLANTSSTSSVSVTIGTLIYTSPYYTGGLNITGNTTLVALAKATAAAPATSYTLTVTADYGQGGGNFSLQDYDGATGSSTLKLRGSLNQTGGTLNTNSTSISPTVKFVVHMADPRYISTPSGIFPSLRGINMSSGTIDNANHNVTLRIEHSVYVVSNAPSNISNGVILQSPLSVGKLELVRSPLTTSSANVLTVNNPALDAITIGGPSTAQIEGYSTGPNYTSYVNGPIKRATNSTQPYLFPTGKGNFYNVQGGLPRYDESFVFDSCYVIPASSEPSMYQAEYFRTVYPDANVTAPLLDISNSEYWDFAKISGADAQVKLKRRKPVVALRGSSSLVAAHYENGHWVASGSAISSCAAIVDSFIVSKPMSTFSSFTFGYISDGTELSVPADLTAGLAYKFYQGENFESLPDFNALTPFASGVSSNVDINVRPAGANYNYAFKWDGYITISTPGTYTFETVSDDGSKVYFNMPYCKNAAAVVENDGVHGALSPRAAIYITIPTAGTYPITITYFQNYNGQSMQLYWAGPGIARQQIPDAVFKHGGTTTPPPPSSGTGLNYKYYEGSFDVLPDFGTLTPVKTGTTPNVDISVRTPGVNDNFAFTWDGTITIPTTGTYTFETVSDDGSRLSFNGNSIVSNDGLHAPASATGSVTIAAGTYPIAISYFEKDGGETMQVYWSGPGIARQLIPDAAFGSGTVTPPAGGLNYKYYEGDFNTLPDFNMLTPVKTGTSANTDITVRTPGVNDHFAFVWTGSINVPSAGTYTFETISDDGSQLSFNGSILVNNDGLHAPASVTGTVTVPAAGAYPVTISYFEKDGGETMQLYWTGPGIARQLIPDAAFIPGNTPPPANTSGLNYKYYEGDFNTLPDYSSLTPVKTGTSANVDISVRTPGVNDHFAVIWSGYINLPSAGTYTFETISDDGSQLSINGSVVVNNNGLHAPTSVTGTVTFSAPGAYPVTVSYFEKDGGETMQLYWSGPGITRQPVPDAAFTTTGTASGVATMSGDQKTTINNLSDRNNVTSVYPNPFAERFTIEYYHSGDSKNKVSINVYDLNGKLMYSHQPSNLVTGNNRWLIDMGAKNLTAGVYMAQIKVNGVTVKSVKLVKVTR